MYTYKFCSYVVVDFRTMLRVRPSQHVSISEGKNTYIVANCYCLLCLHVWVGADHIVGSLHAYIDY